MTWNFLCKVTFQLKVLNHHKGSSPWVVSSVDFEFFMQLKVLNSPWVVASVDRGEGAEGHIIWALAVLGWAVNDSNLIS